MSSAPDTCVDLILIENHNIVVHNNAMILRQDEICRFSDKLGM